MLLGADHVGDAEVAVVDHAAQVVDEGAVGALDELYWTGELVDE